MEQCTYGATGSVKRSASIFAPLSSPPPSSLRAAFETRYYFYVATPPATLTPSIDLGRRHESSVHGPRETTKFRQRAAENSVNDKSAGRQRRTAATTHRVSLFAYWVPALCTEQPVVQVEKRVSLLRAVEPHNELITSRLFECSRPEYQLSREEKRFDVLTW